MRLPLIRCLLVALASLLAARPAHAADETSAARRPNIILVLVDDAGYADFPFFNDAHPRTPRLDQLAREGLRFTSFYVNAPICSASRAALTTGQFPARTGITSYLDSRTVNKQRGIRDWLDPAAFTLPRALKERGYATGHFGKWHLGGGRDVGDAPSIAEYGFDQSLTQFEGLGDRVLPLTPPANGTARDKFPLGVQSERLGRGKIQWTIREEVTGAFVSSTIEFIRQAESAGQPFYVNLWPDDVHTPLFPPAELRGDGTKRARYLGVLEHMDAQLGELFDHVRSSAALRENTIIIIMSDNGPEAGAGSCGKLRGGKAQLYEGGIREPLIVWGPGWVDAAAVGSTNETSVLSSVDVVASLLKLTGASAPAQLDGEDLSETLLGKRRDSRKAPLMWTRPPDRPGPENNRWPDLAVREGPWKLLVDKGGGRVQLYDLAQDPNETTNVAEAHPEIAARLKDLVLNWSAAPPPLATQ